HHAPAQLLQYSPPYLYPSPSTSQNSTLSLHDALPIYTDKREIALVGAVRIKSTRERLFDEYRDVSGLRRSQVFLEVGTFSATPRSEEHTSELQSRGHLVCRLLLEKKKKPVC